MRKFLFIALAIIVIGCNAKHCITYESDKYGNIEYCYDATGSQKENTPVYTNDEQKESVFVVEEGFLKDIEKALSLIGLLNKVAALGTPDVPNIVPESIIKRIKQLLEQQKKKE